MRPIHYLTALLALTFFATPVLAEDQSGFEIKTEAGYRIVSTDDNPGHAGEYDYLHSSPTFELLATGHSGHKHAILEADYLNKNDYSAEVHLDHSGVARLELRAERFFHNLDHIPYANRPDAIAEANTGNPADNQLRATFSDHDPGKDYELKIDTYEAGFRGKLKSYPAHLNVNYWRYEKKGDQQLRFVSEQCTGCHVQSRTNDTDWVTQEVTASVDAHIGPVDIIFEQLYREFDNKEDTPVDNFGFHALLRPASADLAHDDVPDSKLTESTLRLHTTLSGGIVGAASFSIGERKNRSDISPLETNPVDSETDFYKGAGDLTWIPNPAWTFNFRYRLLDLDNDNSDSISISGIFPTSNPIPVRENIDIRRDNYISTVSYRPFKSLTVKGEFEREEIHRGNANGALPHSSGFFGGPVDIDPVWEVPKDERLDRVKLGFFSRPLGSRNLKLNGWWEMQSSDDPAYGTSFEDSHQVFLGANYTSKGIWGSNLSVDALWQENDQYQITEFDGGGTETFDLDRDHDQLHINAGIWANLTEGLYTSLSYGYLNSDTKQDLLFGNEPPDYTFVDNSVEYSQEIHTVSASVNWQAMEQLQCHLTGYHTRSEADYSPGFARFYSPTGIFDATSTGLKEISEVDLRQTGLKAGVTWQLMEQMSCRVDYTYDDYEDRNKSIFDGTVQTYMANLAYAW